MSVWTICHRHSQLTRSFEEVVCSTMFYYSSEVILQHESDQLSECIATRCHCSRRTIDQCIQEQTGQTLGGFSVRENVVSHSKKRKKSCFLDFEKSVKTLKNVRSFTGHFITQPLITHLPEVSTGKSRSPTSNILLRSVDTRKYATENCVW